MDEISAPLVKSLDSPEYDLLGYPGKERQCSRSQQKAP